MGIGEQGQQNPNMTFHQDPDWFMTGSLCREHVFSEDVPPLTKWLVKTMV